MLSTLIVKLVAHCARYRWIAIGVAAVVAGVAGVYAASHFQITTDTEQLLPDNLAWRQHQIAYAKAFPQHQIVAVVDAPTPELTQIATGQLVERLKQQTDLFTGVAMPQGGEFMQRNALLYRPLDQVQGTARQLAGIQPVLVMLEADPSLRGVMHALSGGTVMVQRGRLPANALTQPMSMLSDAIEPILDGKFGSLSGLALLDPNAASPDQRRQFIEIDPKLDYSSLRPGTMSTS
jgi:hypothetical protein